MTSGAPWSVKGIDPKAREIAKDLARRSGMTLGEWLNHMITEGGPEIQAAPEPAPPARRRFDHLSDRPSALAQRLQAAPVPADDDAELERIAEALDRLSVRIEAAEHRSTLAISGMDQSVMGVLSRIEAAERTQNQVAARFEDVVDDVRADQSTLAERLARLETERSGARSAEALKSLEGALTRVAGHLYEGEGRTRDSIASLKQELDSLSHQVRSVSGANDPGGASAVVDQVVDRIAARLDQSEALTTAALKRLEGSFAHLDQRLKSTEERVDAGGPAERRLEQLAADLSRRVDEVRAELAERPKGSSDHRLESALREMAGQVQAVEHRSTQAIERMGHEVVRMTDQLSQKVVAVEQRSADAIGKVSGDMARIADAMEGRLKRADSAQAEALEKLGGEIARITERLAERIANAERRSAQSMDDVGEQMSRVTDRLQQRQERASSELMDRMRQSEERTAKLLDEAREKIDQRLSDTQRRITESVPAYAAPPQGYADPFASPFGGPFGAQPFGQGYQEPAYPPQEFTDADYPAPSYAPAAYSEPAPPPAPLEPEGFTPEPPFEAADSAPAFAESDFDAADDFESVEPELEADENEAAPVGSLEVPVEGFAPEARSASTRELIAQARAAARAAQEATEKKGRKGKEPEVAKGGGGAGKERDTGLVFSGFGIGRKKKAENSALKTALLMSGVAACLGLGAAGVVLQNGGTVAGWSADRGDAKTDDGVKVAANGEEAVATPPPTLDPKLALAMAPSPEMAPAPPSAEAQTLYQQAVQAIDAGDAGGLDPLRRSANLGYAPAQFYLAKLYEDGNGGMKKNLPEARRWAERAAANGEPRAMHQLGAFYYNGEGGERNAVAGYEWFKKAAALGFVDSQFNLGMMSEAGMGVPKNAPEAYKWYLIAGRAGDEEARTRSQRLKQMLTPAQSAIAERAAATFQPESTNASALAPSSVAAAGAGVSTAQRALSRMGYYQGPSDGSQSAALRLAVAAYQRDQGLAPTGVLTPELVQRFANASR